MNKIFFLILVTGVALSVFYYYKDIDGYTKYIGADLIERVKKKTNSDNTYYYFNIWNTSCIPCVKEMPDIDSLAILYKDKVDFIFITNEANEKIEWFLKEKNINLTNCVFLNDEESTIAYLNERIEKKQLSYPTHIIMNDRLEVIHHHTGGISVTGTVSFFNPVLTKALKDLK
ncbi:MAG: hypothetical protein COA97_08845 [Flavobacteriales bacterium]|nr:MAG: hypothetical protein COA97_08845 [Flavobacteriales bacterium]